MTDLPQAANEVVQLIMQVFLFPVPATCGTYLTAVLIGGWLFNRGAGGAKRMYQRRKIK